jgi:hypothetical protein
MDIAISVVTDIASFTGGSMMVSSDTPIAALSSLLHATDSSMAMSRNSALTVFIALYI